MAGIPDYRSGSNTIVPTGPGQWETSPRGTRRKPVHLDKALPTFTHMALQALASAGLLKFTISQNVDGLHHRSGLDPRTLAEIHGNAYREKCPKCSAEFLREFKVRKTASTDHLTGNLCELCQTPLLDCIVHFGDSIDRNLLKTCAEQAQSADLCLALGSSLRVRPAALFPALVAEKGKLVVVNLQRTPFDDVALKINSFCDEVMRIVMQELGIDVKEFTVRKRIVVGTGDEGKVWVKSLDFWGKENYAIRSVKWGNCLENKGEKENEGRIRKYFEIVGKREDWNQEIEIEFFSHFGEPSFKFIFGEGETEKVYDLEYNFNSGKWIEMKN